MCTCKVFQFNFKIYFLREKYFHHKSSTTFVCNPYITCRERGVQTSCATTEQQPHASRFACKELLLSLSCSNSNNCQYCQASAFLVLLKLGISDQILQRANQHADSLNARKCGR